MVVITLTATPVSLRGDLTKWLMEISTGVYVGNISARVRDELWERICLYCKEGQAAMVFSAKNEQHLDFKVHNTNWILTDFDGIKLMKRPSVLKAPNEIRNKEGYSKAAQYNKARLFAKKNTKDSKWPDKLVILDFETTGLSETNDEIIEIGALKLENGIIVNEYSQLIRIKGLVPPTITDLTGIDDSLLEKSGKILEETLHEFLGFLEDFPIIAHNANFEFKFLQNALKSCGIPMIKNKFTDTVTLSKHYFQSAPNFKLQTLLDYLNLDTKVTHRGLADCYALLKLYSQLIENH